MDIQDNIEQIKSSVVPYFVKMGEFFAPIAVWVEELSNMPALGVYESKSGLKTALVEKKGKNYQVSELQSSLPGESLQLKKLPRNVALVAGISSDETLIRQLELKGVKHKDVDSVLPFQAENLLPYPIDEAILDKIILRETPDHIQLSVLAVRKTHVMHRIERLSEQGLEPEFLGSHPVALNAFAQATTESEERLITIYLENQKALVIFNEKGKLIGSHSLKFESSINFEDEEVKQTLLHTIYALTKQARGLTVEKILLTGPESLNISNPEALAEALQKSLVKQNNSRFAGMTLDKLNTFALPIGLALANLQPETTRINFRREEFAYPHPWKRLKKFLAVYGVCCAVFTLLVYATTSTLLSNQLDEAQYNYTEVLSAMGKTPSQFEKEYAKKNLSDAVYIPIQDLSASQIEERLTFLKDEIERAPKIFPLQPQVPLVSDLLAWLSNHPSVTKRTEKGVEPLIQIESLNYQMVKRPEKSKPRDRYQAKVEMIFTSAEPMQAREFHNALLLPNDFVDQRSDVKWSFTEGKYRTSFFLKDKTTYY